MLTIIYQIISITTNTVVLSLVGYTIFTFLKIKNKLYKMDAEELLQENENPTFENTDVDETKRERLSAIVAGGGSKQYLGKDLQISDIDTMTSEQINKLYCRYEARLGASMTKTLGNSFINLYVLGVSKYFKVISPPKLIQDLEEDPFINHALTSSCCELYYRFGMYLAPFTAMLTTMRHIDFKTENINLENDE
jgi:hypothetical protein